MKRNARRLVPLRAVRNRILGMSSGVILMLASLQGTAKAQTTAVSANEFLESIGINTKLSQGIDGVAGVTSSVNYAGFRNIRDDGLSLSKLISVYNNTGAQVCLLPHNGNITSSISRYVQVRNAGALLAAEGPNEPHNWPLTYLSQTSSSTNALPVAWFQRDLYAAVKAEPALAGIPVFGTSAIPGAQPNNCGLQFLTIPNGAGTLMPDGTIYADYANPHNYVFGHQTQMYNNNAWDSMSPTLNASWDGLYGQYGKTWHKKFTGYTNEQLLTLPRVCTETGWETVGSYSISEALQGKLFLNLYLSAYKRGWKHTFIYQLKDFAPYTEYFGLFNQDYTPKLAATYLHNLTTILADTGSFTPGSLNYYIHSKPGTVHDLLIQKSNGHFELAVWNERLSASDTGSDNMSVNLGATFATVNVYDPIVGTSPIQTLSNISSLFVTVSDHPIIIELIGNNGAVPEDIIAGSFVPTSSRQFVDGTQTGLALNKPGGNWIWGGGWNWAAPHITADWDPAPQNIVHLAEGKTALGVSLSSSGSFSKPTKMRVSGRIRITGTTGGGLGFWPVMPARNDSASSLTGLSGLNLKSNGTLQLVVNGSSVGTPVSVGAISAGIFYLLAYEIDTATGTISNVTFDGAPVAGIGGSGFTDAATAYVGMFTGSNGRLKAMNFAVTPLSVPQIQILDSALASTGARQSVNGTTIGLTTNLPGGNWIWGGGWNWAAPFVPATWDPAPYNCINLVDEKTAIGHSLVSSGSYIKPAHIRVSADLALFTSYANGGALGFWSSMPARADGVSALGGFTGLNLKSNGTLQLLVNGSVVGSPVSVGSIVNKTFYTLAYNIDTATGAISNITFNGAPVTGISSTGFTNAATTYVGVLSSSGARALAKDIKVSSW